MSDIELVLTCVVVYISGLSTGALIVQHVYDRMHDRLPGEVWSHKRRTWVEYNNHG